MGIAALLEWSVDAVFGVEGLVNPRGFVLIDAFQRNPTYKNVYSVGVCVAIPPVARGVAWNVRAMDERSG